MIMQREMLIDVENSTFFLAPHSTFHPRRTLRPHRTLRLHPRYPSVLGGSSQINFPVPGVHLPTVAKAPPASREYQGGFVTALAHKDLDLAVEAARVVDSPLYVGKLAEEIFRKVRGTEDWDARDFSIVYKWLEEKSASS